MLGRLASRQDGEVTGVADLDAQPSVVREHQIPGQVRVGRVRQQIAQRPVEHQQGSKFMRRRGAA